MDRISRFIILWSLQSFSLPSLKLISRMKVFSSAATSLCYCNPLHSERTINWDIQQLSSFCFPLIQFLTPTVIKHSRFFFFSTVELQRILALQPLKASKMKTIWCPWLQKQTSPDMLLIKKELIKMELLSIEFNGVFLLHSYRSGPVSIALIYFKWSMSC